MGVEHPRPKGHGLGTRTTHWVNVAALTCMIGSGWRIYDASPFLPFSFPPWLTLGDWLGGALAIHFAAMWLLAANFLAYLVLGFASRHIARDLLPVRLAALRADLVAALRFRLTHDGGYNAIQKLLYLLAGLGIAGAIVSGAVLWKPAQFQIAASLLGGYEGARRVHFAAMAGLVTFTIVHVAMVALVPSTLRSMITGRARAPAVPR